MIKIKIEVEADTPKDVPKILREVDELAVAAIKAQIKLGEATSRSSISNTHSHASVSIQFCPEAGRVF